jgi:hypothetical protein
MKDSSHTAACKAFYERRKAVIRDIESSRCLAAGSKRATMVATNQGRNECQVD